MSDPITLDVKGLNCPLPILKAKKAIKDLDTGQVLEVVATDPGSVKDFEAFCRQTGNELVSSSQDGDVYTFQLRKA
ncbi:sulfurtransferase TusA family protein [Roseospirillum parvum]|uniref:tRNA 2-thiouridine synthesizing protein A n=1 Tax=Roseospirillum parvum TaxID=83401 RepID=A0A1G8ALH1_9PROT|nr:sulfurtransferase TusA family protein [Roseospirillum parvum]SDH21757.1 tRNA 2-thiouridine synthesizing protein A [Roseospirillum parvum]